MKFCKHELLARVINTSFGKRMHLLSVYPIHKSKSTTRITRTLVSSFSKILSAYRYPRNNIYTLRDS